MRIAYVITRSDALGGASIHVRDLSSSLIASGHEVRVFIGGEGVVTEALQKKEIPYAALKKLKRSVDPMADIQAIFELRSALKAFGPDIVSCHTSKAGLIGRIAGKLLGVPTIYTPHCWSFCDGFPHAGFYRWIEKIGAVFGPKIVMVSEWERQLGIEKAVAKTSKLITIHNGMPDIVDSLRAHPKIAPPTIAMIGRFEEQKNHRMLLMALSSLKDLDWKVQFIGNGPLEEEAKALSEELDIRDRIHFAGYRTDIAECLSKVQVFALISNWESFPRSILEAMRAGLPVITTDAGGSAEAVSNGANGYVVGLRDSALLESRLRTIIEDSELRQKMGNQSRERYEAFFTFDRMQQETLNLYNSSVRVY